MARAAGRATGLLWPLLLLQASSATPPPVPRSRPVLVASVFGLQRPSLSKIAGLMRKSAGWPHNHDFAQSTRLPSGTHREGNITGFTVIEHSQQVGKGKGDYAKAVSMMREWRMMDNVQWAGISKEEDGGSGIVTWAKVFNGPFWVLNPCRQTYDDQDIRVPAGRWSGGGGGGECVLSQVAYSTLKGHLITGEERFSVDIRDSDEAVTFRIRSISHGSGLAGRLLFPLMGGMQRRYFRDQVTSMQASMHSSKDT